MFRDNGCVKSAGISLRFSIPCIAALALALGMGVLPASGVAKSRPRHAVADRDYISALAAANNFLHAWQAHDHESGLLMLTDYAKRHSSEATLESFFAPSPLTQQGFLITSGRKLKPGRYVFEVALLEAVSEKETIRHHFSRIVVVRAGKDDWAVDNVP